MREADRVAAALDVMLEHWVQGTTATDEQGREATAALMAFYKAQCTCLSELQDDSYGAGGPMSGRCRPSPCKVHSIQKGTHP